jgi:hypothetical protein
MQLQGRHTYLFLHMIRLDDPGGSKLGCADCALPFFFAMAEWLTWLLRIPKMNGASHVKVEE